MPTDFHRRAAKETLLVLDALGIERTMLWGHSDGAVIASFIGLIAPQRCERLVLEAFHLYRNKPRSREIFFERFANHPGNVSEKLQKRLAEDHGREYWKNVVQRNCRVWLELASQGTAPGEDLYCGGLCQLHVPVTFIHGRQDPRTEPEEIERASAMLTDVETQFLEGGRHSPHSEDSSSRQFTGFLRSVSDRA